MTPGSDVSLEAPMAPISPGLLHPWGAGGAQESGAGCKEAAGTQRTPGRRVHPWMPGQPLPCPEQGCRRGPCPPCSGPPGLLPGPATALTPRKPPCQRELIHSGNAASALRVPGLSGYPGVQAVEESAGMCPTAEAQPGGELTHGLN